MWVLNSCVILLAHIHGQKGEIPLLYGPMNCMGIRNKLKQLFGCRWSPSEAWPFCFFNMLGTHRTGVVAVIVEPKGRRAQREPNCLQLLSYLSFPSEGLGDRSICLKTSRCHLRWFQHEKKWLLASRETEFPKQTCHLQAKKMICT